MTNKNDILDKLIQKISDSKTLPWNSPYLNAGVIPVNAATGKPYRGINIFILGIMPSSKSLSYITFKQGEALGLKLKKGSKADQVVFFTNFTKEDKETGEDKEIKCWKHYNVFPVEFFEGYESCDKLQINKQVKINKSPAEIEISLSKIIYDLRINLVNENNRVAYYQSEGDTINMPSKEFMVSEMYNSTLAHELIHATGHKSRLDRALKSFQCSKKSYSFEELIAESGSCLLCNELGITYNIDNSSAYIKNWISYLKDNKSKLISAFSKAQKAVDFILNKEAVK
jgi:antirestriction protein ArdC